MIPARVSQAGDFKNCCMLSGEFDGSDRHHFFQRVMAVHESLEVIARQLVSGRGTRWSMTVPRPLLRVAVQPLNFIVVGLFFGTVRS